MGGCARGSRTVCPGSRGGGPAVRPGHSTRSEPRAGFILLWASTPISSKKKNNLKKNYYCCNVQNARSNQFGFVYLGCGLAFIGWWFQEEKQFKKKLLLLQCAECA